VLLLVLLKLFKIKKFAILYGKNDASRGTGATWCATVTLLVKRAEIVLNEGALLFLMWLQHYADLGLNLVASVANGKGKERLITSR
jgi:hypothetical protein